MNRLGWSQAQMSDAAEWSHMLLTGLASLETLVMLT